MEEYREIYISQAIPYIKIKLGIVNTQDDALDESEEDDLLAALCIDAYNYMYLFFDCDPDDEENHDVPAQLRFVLESVVIKRYRRMGAEGIAIEKIDVLSTTYESGDDFAEYLDIMNKYKHRKIGRNNGPKGFRFF